MIFDCVVRSSSFRTTRLQRLVVRSAFVSHLTSTLLLAVVPSSQPTFSYLHSGMGSSTILRGKFYVIGDNKDQLWCQIWRFGFGRSVSGSVYSEGTHLSKDDEKTYWGRIEYAEDEGNGVDGSKDEGNVDPSATVDKNGKLVVKGSVILGGNGLEPQPIGRFILSERTTNLTEEEEDQDEEEDDDDDDIDGSSDDQPFFGLDDAFQ